MPQINKPSSYFNTKLYTGNGSTQSISGIGFQPDFTWIKVRSTTGGHRLVDAVRGATKFLVSNATNAEGTDATQVASLDSDGFTVGSDSATNLNSGTFASWNWLASNTTASNTDGSITSTVSANTTSGFSIVSYTGTGSVATVGHSLGTIPSMIIIKNRSGVADWLVYHKSIGNTGGLYLNSTSATVTASGFFNNTSPTSSVFTIGTGGTPNNNGSNYIAYCFAEKKGFSKFGSYVGNGSTDGSYIHLGFKPAFVITKRTDSPSDWVILDNKRNSFNVVDKKLESSNSDADTTQTACDFLSNGIKLKDTTTSYLGTNISGGTYIYMAFAESPLVGTNNIPAVAR